MKAWGRVTAATLVACLTLAACSGHKSKTSNVHLNNNDGHTTSSPKKNSSLTSGGPAFNFPADLTVEFDNWVSTGDATKDKVLSDYSILLKALVMAQVNPDNPDRTWLQYVTVTGQPGFATFLASRKTKGLTITGTETYRNPKVTSVQGTTAQVTMCQDDTKLLDKNDKTGNTVAGSTDPTHTYPIQATLVQNGGIWKVASSTGKQGTC